MVFYILGHFPSNFRRSIVAPQKDPSSRAPWTSNIGTQAVNHSIFIWLVVLTILKNISQWEGLSHILWKIKNDPNHQPVINVMSIPDVVNIHKYSIHGASGYGFLW